MTPVSFERVALVILGATVIGCGSRLAPVRANPTTPGTVTTPRAPTHGDVDETQARHDRLLGDLARIQRAMRPVCGKRCGTVMLIARDDIGASAGTSAIKPGFGSFLYYQPGDRRVALNTDLSWRFYGLAHEYGHHLDVTMAQAPATHPWSREMRADTLAGCAFALAKVPLDDLADALDDAVHEEPMDERRRKEACGLDEDHPSLAFTREALREGANACANGPVSQLELGYVADQVTIAAARVSARRLREAPMQCGRGTH